MATKHLMCFGVSQQTYPPKEHVKDKRMISEPIQSIKTPSKTKANTFAIRATKASGVKPYPNLKSTLHVTYRICLWQHYHTELNSIQCNSLNITFEKKT